MSCLSSRGHQRTSRHEASKSQGRRQLAPRVGNLVNNMTAAGIDPKNIDTILVSHFHGDHISGIRAKGEESRAPQV